MENYGTPQRPFYFTPNLCFPFLICEAKTGRVGLDLADTQNLHSASIATRAIVNLYAATFGAHHEKTQQLFGRILVFTISHNNRIANLYGHYAVAASTNSENNTGGLEASFQFFRYDIAMFSLSMHDGRDRFKTYKFVRNLYDKFAPQHLERILEATRSMPKPIPRTGLSFAASDITLDEEDLKQGSEINSQEDDVFKMPSEPASASQKRELTATRRQVDRLLQQLEQQREDSEQKLEQQRMDSKLREQIMDRRMELMMESFSKPKEA